MKNDFINDDMYYWEDDDDNESCGYASTFEEIVKEVKDYVENNSNSMESVNIYKKIYTATPLITTEMKTVE